MKLEKIIIQNFRCFKERIEIDISDITVFVGQNDAGKSTILEAMDIFFNDKDAMVKLDSEDLTIGSKKKEIIIGAAFSEFPEKIIIDIDTPTSVVDEYLLNSKGMLEIHKKYSSGKLKEVVLIANHPNNKVVKDLLSLKIDKLKEIADLLKVDDMTYDARICSSIRKAIRENQKGKFKLAEIELKIFAEKDEAITREAKEIWHQFEEYLPLFRLFQSDRKNEEKDVEIQFPLKFAIKRTLESDGLKQKLADIQEEVQNTLLETANKTLKKLAEMNPEIAKQLRPDFKRTAWEKAFDFTLLSDDEVPLDKRGSGVKRLILLNFFRAEAERLTSSRQVPNAIYAIEEPETSQHPDHQRKLINAFLQIVKVKRDQVILTTHSPGIARLIPPESLNLLKKDTDSKIILARGTSEIYQEIAQILGILPDIELKDITKVRLAICLEGKNDVVFIKNLNNAIPDFKNIIDLNNDERIIILPMGGSALQFWVNNDYLGRLKLNQFHLYDSDIGSNNEHQYKNHIDSVNARGEGNYGCETQLREFENYISPAIIKKQFGIELPTENWNTLDIPEEIAKYNLSVSESTKCWDLLDDDEKKKRTGRIKNQIAEICSKKIDNTELVSMGVYDEIKRWFDKIAELAT